MTDTGRDRIDAMFAAAAGEDRAVLLPYLTAGIPDPDASVELFASMADAGADGFEVGIPYADPLMDGPVIMAAGERALASGVTVDVALDVVRRVVERTGKPVLVMTYVNPVLRNGIDDFFDRVAATGASGVILADLPADEAEPYLAAAHRTGLGMVLFAAPTTDTRRMTMVSEADAAFIYAVAEIGVTGERLEASSNLESLARTIRAATDRPIVFGVGISTPDHAAAAARHGDGVIVGTAIVRRVLEASDVETAAATLAGTVRGFAEAMHRE
jgi:tryptophan synthase alpha chain